MASIAMMKKLYLGVNETGLTVARALTTSTVDDAITGVNLIDEVNSKIKTVIGDDRERDLALSSTQVPARPSSR